MSHLSFTIPADLEKKLKHISELAAEKRTILEGVSPTCRDMVHRYARISNIGASTRIENAVLTDSEIDWMDHTLGVDGRHGTFEQQQTAIADKLSKDKERSIEEVAGLRRVITIIHSQAAQFWPLEERDVRALHHELLQYFPASSHYRGQYKHASNSVIERVGNTVIREVFTTADPGPVTTAAMHDLFAWYHRALPDALWAIAVVTEFVYRFLAIHPFQDGNGRLGRALFLLGLLHAPDTHLNYVAPYLAIDRQIEKHREEYYIVLQQCSGGSFRHDPQEYRIEIFLRFMLTMIDKALREDIDYYIAKYEQQLELGSTAHTILDCFREHPEQRLSSGDIVTHTGLIRRTVMRTLNTLVTAGFLQRSGKGPATRYQLIF